MKKIFSLMLAAVLSLGVMAESYELNDNNIETLIASAADVTESELVSFEEASLGGMNMMNVAVAGKQTMGGYLLRSFFCGGLALHRYYMGTTGAKMFFMYFCIPVVSNVAVCLDFWLVVFKGETQMKKYKNNDKYLVWAN